MPAAARRFALYAVVAFLAVLYCYGLDAEPRNDSHWWRMAIAGASAVLVVGYSVVMGLPEQWKVPGLEVVRASLLGLTVFGWFNYYQFDKGVLDGIGDSVDITYYYTNSKYLDELGYFGLYPAMILADQEGGNRHPVCQGRRNDNCIWQYRDLRDYDVKPVALALEHGQQIKDERFTPERWEAFKHDVDFFLRAKSTRTMQSNFYVDHGYNPPPTWSVVGGALANLAPVEEIKSIARIDIYLVAVMFAGIAWAFGFDTFLFASLFFVCTFSGRWPILGEALLRFDWVAALVLAVCCLKKEQYALAGGFMAYAGLNRVFPMIFFFGWGIVALFDTVRTRKLLPEHIRFVGGAALVTVLLVGAALGQYGPQTFKDSAQNLLMHNKSYSSHRVGLGDLLLFRGEASREEMAKTEYVHPDGKVTTGIAAKEIRIQEMQPLLRLAALASLVFLSVYVYRTKRRDMWALVPLAILPFYCATNPQINYYNLRLLLFLWHGWMVASDARPRFFHRVALVLLFVCEFATQWAYLTPNPDHPAALAERYYVTCTTSVWLGLYLAVLVGRLVQEGWMERPASARAVPSGEPAPA
ncbi:MAG: hypothetical protein R3F61_33815 [Myxococcota bacterium]